MHSVQLVSELSIDAGVELSCQRGATWRDVFVMSKLWNLGSNLMWLPMWLQWH